MQFNGFGGKLEPGESIVHGAVREMKEESGVDVLDPSLRGYIKFTFEGSPEILHVYVFRATDYTGEVQESEEMAPQWFPQEDIPLDKMWADDAYWLPLLLAGKCFRASFHFVGHATIVQHSVEEVSGPEGVGVDPEDTSLVTAVQGAIIS